MRGIHDAGTSAIDSGLNFTPRHVVSTFFSIEKAKKSDLKTRKPGDEKNPATKCESLIEAFMSGALSRRASQSSPVQSEPSLSESFFSVSLTAGSGVCQHWHPALVRTPVQSTGRALTRLSTVPEGCHCKRSCVQSWDCNI